MSKNTRDTLLSSTASVEIDELDRLGVTELMPILRLKHPVSVFRFVREHPDFPPGKKLGQRVSWARGAVLRYVLAQPDRTAGDPVISKRLVSARKPRRGKPLTRPSHTTT
jgi:hypothetical protein